MSTDEIQDAGRLLTPAEVAQRFRVDPKTVTRWALQGKIASVRTLGGHRRYREADVERLMTHSQQQEVVRDGTLCGDAKGTYTGYLRHRSYGDMPCAECLVARKERDFSRRRAAK